MTENAYGKGDLQGRLCLYFVIFCLLSRKGINPKRNEILFIEYICFQKGGKIIMTELSPLKVYLFP